MFYMITLLQNSSLVNQKILKDDTFSFSLGGIFGWVLKLCGSVFLYTSVLIYKYVYVFKKKLNIKHYLQ